MAAGRILVANGDGACLMKFVGDVRLSLGAAMEEYLDRLFEEGSIRLVQVDLSATDSIDSTSLGVLARLSVQAKSRLKCTPTLISTRPDITRMLTAMGFDDVFRIVQEPLEAVNDGCVLGELPKSDLSTEELRTRVLDAHRELMCLNDGNRAQFKDLVAALEASRE